MIVKLKDGGSFWCSKEDADKIIEAVGNPNTRIVDIRRLNIAIKAFSPQDFLRIDEGGENPNQPKLPPPPEREISDEERARNLKRLAQIKADFQRKRIKRQQKQNKKPASPIGARP